MPCPRFDRVVDHHVAHDGQRVHLVYLVNDISGARLLVAQGTPLHSHSPLYARHRCLLVFVMCVWLPLFQPVDGQTIVNLVVHG